MNLLRLPAAPGKELRTCLRREFQRNTRLIEGRGHFLGQHFQQRRRGEVENPMLKRWLSREIVPPVPRLLLLLGRPASLRSQPAPGSLDGQAARIIRVALARPTNPTELARARILASLSGEPLPYAQEFPANPLQPIVTIAADPSDTDGHRVRRQDSRPCRSRLVPARK